MNTSYGPRIDADRWDFHDGIDLPAAVGTPVHAMAEGTVLSAGPADRTGTGQGFGSPTSDPGRRSDGRQG